MAARMIGHVASAGRYAGCAARSRRRGPASCTSPSSWTATAAGPRQRGLPRALGHRAGVAALRRTVEAAPSLGIERLTVFGFSTENWRRPPREVSELMGLLKAYFESDLARLERDGVRVRDRRPPHRPGSGHPRDRRARRGPHRQQRPLPSAGRVQLRRPGRHRRRGAPASPGGVATGGSTPATSTKPLFEAALSTAAGAGAGPDHPHQRRTAAVQLPALGVRLRRAGLPGRATGPTTGPST